ncbi:MAG: [citrate (pro-3S)-lyase] ligase [Muribaculaceae bacterium]|nr:[citrate (pro-3S)-lyase] ligase [Muribaculaceae bacterium]
MYSEYEITQMPLALKSCRTRVERFLAENELRLDDVDYYAVVTRLGDDTILAGGGLSKDIIKCIAVDDSLRGTGMSQRLVSHLLSMAGENGYRNVKVYTKPTNVEIFTSMAFRQLAASPLAVLMENGLGGLSTYCNYLNRLKRDGHNGVIVMNCNPLTLGHRYLVEQAAQRVDNLYVIIVNEDLSLFGTRQRTEMARKACEDLPNVTVCNGSDYTISALTFPTYFLKQLSDASDTHMTLDIDLFARHIAPALGATVRFAGTEPHDALTCRYNELMKELLPCRGIEVVEIERKTQDGAAISASKVRQLLEQEELREAVALVPATTIPYVVSKQAVMSLKKELATTPKPGLVDHADNGAHQDMDYALMLASIDALEPYFDLLAQHGFDNDEPDAQVIRQIGIDAEAAMLKATRGVNTHRGALFSMGLAIVAAAQSLRSGKDWAEVVKAIAAQIPTGHNSNGAKAREQYKAKGALDLAREGYSELTNSWLPAYRNASADAELKTLLLIMSQLDDTNVIHRVGYDKAQQVKRDAKEIYENFNLIKVEELNRRFNRENISPGGAADMLALTFFINAIK